MKTLIGIVSFGNLNFTKLAVNSIKETTTKEIDFFIVVGKPGDWETRDWLNSQGIPNVMHTENMGFPFSLNDIYDYGWKSNDYDNIIIAGNDVVAYPYCVDSLIEVSETTDYECISATEYDVKTLTAQFPETSSMFRGSRYIFEDFKKTPWLNFMGYSGDIKIMDMQLLDIQNFCLYKKSVFDKVGYTDVNFYPAYFVDNDYVNRMVRAGIKGCSLANAKFFHFWSRTIHQGTGGSTHTYFKNNEQYYKSKWGGKVGQETKVPLIKIATRDNEVASVRNWRNKA